MSDECACDCREAEVQELRDEIERLRDADEISTRSIKQLVADVKRLTEENERLQKENAKLELRLRDAKHVSSVDLADLRAEVERLRGALPDGMEHCTIKFVECQKGHGRLTATNWIDHGCGPCRLSELYEEIERLKKKEERG